MDENANDKMAAEAEDERDERIAPPTAASAATAPASEAPSSRRPPAKTLVAGVVAAAVALVAIMAGVGYAVGWFGQAEPADVAVHKEDRAVASQEKEQDGDGASGADAAASFAEAGEAADQAAPAQPEAAAPAPDSAPEPEADASPSVESPAAPESTPAPEPAPEPEPTQPSAVTVSVYVDSSRAASEGWPSCMASASVTISAGASVYDALCATGAAVGGSSGYVRSINGLAEFSCGPSSGWLYFVNGSSPGIGCGSYSLYGGEDVTWVYTLDMGDDL